MQLSGCVSYRVIPNSDLPDYSKYKHVVYSENSKYPLEIVQVAQGTLSGKVNFNRPDKQNTINVYVFSDSMIMVDTENMLNLPLNDITKVEIVKMATGKTILLVAGCTLGLIILISSIVVRNVSLW